MSRLLIFSIMVFIFPFIGCNTSPITDEAQGDSFVQLNAIHRAYAQFSEATGKPPESADDLKEILIKANQDPETIFVSASDGQPFVIHWGVQAINTSPEPTVIAYEGNGKNGQRMVLTSMGVIAMSEKELIDGSFPAGFSPPSTPH